MRPSEICAEVISPDACQLATLLPVSQLSHKVTAVVEMCTSVVEPGKMAAASVGAEAILVTRSSSATWGESSNNDVEVAVEYSRLDVLFHQPKASKVVVPVASEVQRPDALCALQTFNTSQPF
jgi:hypothetical protein